MARPSPRGEEEGIESGGACKAFGTGEGTLGQSKGQWQESSVAIGVVLSLATGVKLLAKTSFPEPAINPLAFFRFHEAHPRPPRQAALAPSAALQCDKKCMQLS